WIDHVGHAACKDEIEQHGDIGAYHVALRSEGGTKPDGRDVSPGRESLARASRDGKAPTAVVRSGGSWVQAQRSTVRCMRPASATAYAPYLSSMPVQRQAEKCAVPAAPPLSARDRSPPSSAGTAASPWGRPARCGRSLA